MDTNRRDVVGLLAAGALSQQGAPAAEIPKRPLGRTGQQVSLVGLGGSFIGERSLPPTEAIRLMHAAIDRGITFFDNSWDYNDGESERRMGQALTGGKRQSVFLMTKFDGRTKQAAATQIIESLQRLQTDSVDLMQFHELIRFEDVDRFFAPGGAAEALEEAKQSGKTRFIGFTGHKDPQLHLYMLQEAARHGMRFDACQLPVNVMDAHYRSFTHRVLPELARLQIGAIGMKSMGGGVILKSNTASAEQCLRFALSQNIATLVTGIDHQDRLDQAVRVASNFRPMPGSEVSQLLARTRDAAQRGEYELFKTSQHFDATARHPEWLGEESERVKQLTTDRK